MVSFGEHNAPKATKDGYQTRHFYCGRSYMSQPGPSKNTVSSGETKRRNRMSGKMETVCTAKIKTIQRVPSAEIVAEVCLKHYGHELDDKTSFTLTKSVQTKILRTRNIVSYLLKFVFFNFCYKQINNDER